MGSVSRVYVSILNSTLCMLLAQPLFVRCSLVQASMLPLPVECHFVSVFLSLVYPTGRVCVMTKPVVEAK